MTATTTAPTQVQHPARAVARTVVQVIITGAPVVPLIVVAIGDDAPGWLVPILGGALVLAGIVTRVMAIKQVDDWLSKLGLSAQPRPVDPPDISRLDRLDGIGLTEKDVDDS